MESWWSHCARRRCCERRSFCVRSFRRRCCGCGAMNKSYRECALGHRRKCQALRGLLVHFSVPRNHATTQLLERSLRNFCGVAQTIQGTAGRSDLNRMWHSVRLRLLSCCDDPAGELLQLRRQPRQITQAQAGAAEHCSLVHRWIAEQPIIL